MWKSTIVLRNTTFHMVFFILASIQGLAGSALSPESTKSQNTAATGSFHKWFSAILKCALL